MDIIRAIIFDLDGVIIDSEPLHAEAKRLTFEHYGIEVPPTLYDQFKGRTDLDVIEHVVGLHPGRSLSVAELLGHKHRAFESLLDQLPQIPGALEFLELARRYIPRLALTTSATKRNQRIAFAKFDLHRYFDVVVTEEEIEHTKPHPEPYLKTVERLGIEAASCLVIEDSLNGVISARDAGCRVAALTTSFSAEELLRAGADNVFSSYRELTEHLQLPC
ncbi:MAG TPA: HAD family phosphatase [Blastocatellia bacterium]|nr:HAD family phosphatase [Blastocatellia bacterium]